VFNRHMRRQLGLRWEFAGIGQKKNGFPQIEGNFEPRPVHSVDSAPVAKNDLAALMPTSGSTGPHDW